MDSSRNRTDDEETHALDSERGRSEIETRPGGVVAVLGVRCGGVRALTRVVEPLVSGPDASAPFVSFWDLHESRINRRLLALMRQTPDDVGWKWGADLEADPGVASLRREAVRFVGNGLAIRGGRLGLRDFRTSRLLGFWSPVLREVGCPIRFIVALRNPATVAAALGAREGTAPQRAYLLWLRSVLPAVLDTAGCPRLLVDCDEALSDPESLAAGIAGHFGWPRGRGLSPFSLSGRRPAASRSLLDRTIGELEADRYAPEAVVSAYRILKAVAAGEGTLEDARVLSTLRTLERGVDLMTPVLRYVDQLEDSRSGLLKSATAASVRVAQAESLLAEVSAERGRVEREAAERVDRQAQDHVWNSRTSEERIERLIRIARARDFHIGALHRSNSWRATSPLRALSLLLRGRWTEPTTPVPPPVDAEIEEATRWTPEAMVTQTASSAGGGTSPRPGSPFELRSLPLGFDPALYVEMNPDLAGMPLGDAEVHFRKHGHGEGRRYLPPELPALAASAFDRSLDTMLLVTHEASRTGAPILSLNLARSYLGRFNVVALLLGEGRLEEAFRRSGAVVVTVPEARWHPKAAAELLTRLERRFSFRFAIVNSIESRNVVAPLGRLAIPTVSLWHEFATYTRPRGAFAEAALWSTEGVFSTRVTRDDALRGDPSLARASFHVLPQGRCLVPRDSDAGAMAAAADALRHRLRPRGEAPGTQLVIGAGWVHFRKGVDLFIQCAARIIAIDPGRTYRFVWIGGGLDPEADLGYSAYLEDQIERAGLAGRCEFVAETPAIETAYEEADYFLLTSRLDPLPNVAIDAMAFGVPVLCFSGATGIADFLVESGLGETCVAAYLDSADLASKLVALANSSTLHEEVSRRARRCSVDAFAPARYAESLDAVVASARRRTFQEKADAATILASERFRKDFASFPNAGHESDEDAVRRYIRSWASGIRLRKPRPGFHPGIYRDTHGLETPGADPFADFLRAGEPPGPWLTEVLTPSSPLRSEGAADAGTALHLHVHYGDMVPAILNRLGRNVTQPDLFVSLTSESLRPEAAVALRGYPGRVVAVETVPNRGRDIGPLLTWMGRRNLAMYDFIGHIHTKRSPQLNDRATSEAWFDFLIEGLLGGERGGAMADVILDAMRDDPGVGMVFPDDPNVVDWGANRAIAERLAPRLGVGELPNHFNFPVGTMFWARRQALVPLFDLGLDWQDYPPEPLPGDGTILHAMERTGVLALPALGLRAITTNVPGLSR